jgi:hypothetical protein
MVSIQNTFCSFLTVRIYTWLLYDGDLDQKKETLKLIMILKLERVFCTLQTYS